MFSLILHVAFTAGFCRDQEEESIGQTAPIGGQECVVKISWAPQSYPWAGTENIEDTFYLKLGLLILIILLGYCLTKHVLAAYQTKNLSLIVRQYISVTLWNSY